MAKKDKEKDEIETTLKEIKAVRNAVRQYVEFLEAGKGLPKDPEARRKVIDSHREMIAGFEAQIAALKSERDMPSAA
jgi:hypothetical protein